KKNYKNLMMEIKKKLLNLSDNKYSTSILHLPYIYNNEFSEKLTLLYSGLNENITYKELMECIELSEVLYQKSTSVELNKNELDYLSVFNSLLSDISMGKCFDNNITHLSKGNLQEIIIKLNEGNYILDVSSKRINLNISILNDNNYKFDVFISDIGNISIIGNNKKQVASDLFYFLHNINNLKNDNLLFDYDKNGVIGSIYSVDSKDIIPRDLFDKWRFLKNDIIIDINKSNIINIANVNIDKYLLSTLGCKIEGKSIKNINFDNIPNWKDKLNQLHHF
ncbi:hypothetical protein, partial [Proteus myxofaciens]|uniref:hypothetical protein n=1 Tax=Proteus myxofaciens TaxID=184072 RepID=UPI001428C6BB